METIQRERLKQKIHEGQSFSLVEVLPEKEYNKYHLPKATNVPAGKDFESDIQEMIPNKDQDVVLYCANTECDASSKAAKRMEEIGYSNVKDYEEGKEGWKEAGLPVES